MRFSEATLFYFFVRCLKQSNVTEISVKLPSLQFNIYLGLTMCQILIQTKFCTEMWVRHHPCLSHLVAMQWHDSHCGLYEQCPLQTIQCIAQKAACRGLKNRNSEKNTL